MTGQPVFTRLGRREPISATEGYCLETET